MIAEVCVGVLLALVIARVISVFARRLWEPIAFAIASAWPQGRNLPTWFFVTSELITNERWDDQ